MKQEIAVLGLMLVFGAKFIIGVPISPEYHEKWRFPCGLSALPPPPNVPPLTEAQRTEKIYNFLIHFEEAFLRIRNLRNGYRTDRVPTLTSTEICNFGNDLDSIFYHVPEFPDMVLLHGNDLRLCSEISSSLLIDYEKMTRVMIFLEQTIAEEAFYSAGQFAPDLKSLHCSIKQAMCEFHRLEDQCIPSQSTRNSTDLVNSYERTGLGDRSRYERDYLFIKDTLILLKGFSIKYHKCYALLTGTA